MHVSTTYIEILSWYQEALNPQLPIIERKKKIRSIIEGIAKYFFSEHGDSIQKNLKSKKSPYNSFVFRNKIHALCKSDNLGVIPEKFLYSFLFLWEEGSAAAHEKVGVESNLGAMILCLNPILNWFYNDEIKLNTKLFSPTTEYNKTLTSIGNGIQVDNFSKGILDFESISKSYNILNLIPEPSPCDSIVCLIINLRKEIIDSNIKIFTESYLKILNKINNLTTNQKVIYYEYLLDIQLRCIARYQKPSERPLTPFPLGMNVFFSVGGVNSCLESAINQIHFDHFHLKQATSIPKVHFILFSCDYSFKKIEQRESLAQTIEIQTIQSFRDSLRKGNGLDIQLSIMNTSEKSICQSHFSRKTLTFIDYKEYFLQQDSLESFNVMPGYHRNNYH